MEKDCIYYSHKYVDKVLEKYEGCSEGFKINKAVFSTFNHLSVWFPDAYKHMLEVWEIDDETN
jgi:hypothetical protein